MSGDGPVKGKEPVKKLTGDGPKGSPGKGKDLAKKPAKSDPKNKPRYEGNVVATARSTGTPLVEKDRRNILSHLVRGLYERPNSSREDNHLDLQGVVLNNGRVLINTPEPRQQNMVAEILRTLGDEYIISTEAPTRRFRIGLPGYLVDLGMEGATAILMSQNLELPDGGIRPISLFRGHGDNPRPVLFVEVSEAAEAQLESMGFKLKTLTGDVVVRPVSNSRH